ncbi:aldehyde dehydrogenase family protein [Variovorax rhizosphaerae]|uniref:Aldehyde dehydrogenase family protein n=1 Tax=Variovorax rhizosphaerae TaxID=1836200 RepID=A0ABU8WVC5_9BURK
MKHYGKFYIDGEWVDAIGKQRFELIDPSTETPFASISLGSAEDVDRAVAAAAAAFPAFSETGKAERVALLKRIIAAFTERENEVLATISQEMGAPLTLRGQTGAALEALQQAVVTLEDYAFETRQGRNIICREAIGVCGLITPWNWPLQLLCIKLGSALAAGCTMVIKPSEFTPLSTMLMVEIMHAAGVPKGVVNLVQGDGPTVGNAITRHREVAMVSFTGSTRAGILVAEAAAGTVKRVAQELGGKSANIVLPDADQDAAARWNVARAMSNSGQSCHSPSRVLVHESRLAQVLDAMRDAAAQVRVGAPSDPATTMGPVVNRAQFEKIRGYIQSGLDQGAQLVRGGLDRPEGLEAGYYISPTIFAGVTPAMNIASEEIFGPVISVITYRDVAEAIAIANDTDYGLGGYVFAGSIDAGMAVGRKLRAGRIFYNGAPADPSAPMGGYKMSGNGREMGTYGLEEYLEVKAMLGFTSPAAA